MIRFIILFGFMYLFLHLHATGDISKYINMKYSYLTFIMIFVFAFLAFYQLIKWNKQGKNKPEEEHHHDHHGHDHSKDENTFLKKVMVYGLLLFPLVTGIFLPIATLDSNIVKAKGFHFAEIDNDKDQYANHQILRPDTTLYYDADQYKKMSTSDRAKYGKGNSLTLNDDNFLRGLETVYNFPGDFEGKTISLKGFVYHGDDLEKNQLFVFRFGIVHCIADAGVYGMMLDFPKDVNYKDDEWLQVEGTLSTTFYQPFKQTIPYLKVTKWKVVKAPKDEYVYRQY
ncbi:putative membrane protein [Pullulanibacillus pueri]|uniref:UPF0703 protein YcgQ n=1 Tax=Pullulanibacillus pueri TaxID=1437324 RepID=A0A8J2ZYT3_9BACL|nr:TIGR03943 family protein [Pullulanibacillus pueri]MBM7683751.1 putative membrane protein [Pullulanibacillus pueri]GGH87350.1 UPF0703 protein YcgQ [Pullulanibacillus pueri]